MTDYQEIYEEIKNAVYNHIDTNDYSINCDDVLVEHDADGEEFEVDIYEMVNEIYNEDYYIIGTYQATEWIGKNIHLVLEMVEEYQNEFGEPYKDITDTEKLASLTMLMYAQSIIYEVIEDLAEHKCHTCGYITRDKNNDCVGCGTHQY